ncbi:UvrD-helicase domain-containing protein [Paenibacillus sacheonensis]|uniref:DNA 3'-5' helicase n=1 Tax=Paenibacillus sacheonensis TaxID=742054 RepID=A0A7X4YWK1_9BACL|nr:ATP-dependent helicase [Paenibacillus sacheonensis]MBM7568077.1 superfamily I DNA/RNA helicase [Paenibacillus sacheonensis]NBC72894.1 UvrD-helicase domain-containing protein [Paenibacillus sacheonensis]
MAIKMIKLTEEQKDCVKFRTDGELLIRGIPGSGKTTVVLERAIYLSINGEQVTPGPKVLLLTFNKALSTYIKQMVRASRDEVVEAMTFHQWGTQLLRDSGITNYRTISDEKEGFVKFAKNIIRKYGDLILPSAKVHGMSEDRSLIRFLMEEISWIKNNEIKALPQYLDAQRIGRGTQIQLTKAHRETIFDIYEKYQSILKGKRCMDFDDVALQLIDNSERILSNIRPNHVLIDEAQDLTATQLKAIKSLTMKSLTVAADKGQQIYRRGFSWKSVGIDIRGARSKYLGKTFRSTKQIIQLARSLQHHDKQLINDNEFLPLADPDTEGPLPELLISGKTNEELKTMVRKVRQIQAAFPKDNIAIIANSHDRLEEFEESLTEHGIGSIYIKSDEADFLIPGVKLVTFHSSKGLEFDHVIVTGLQEGKLPYRTMAPGDDYEAFIATERKKLYVAMTRAKLTLTLSAVAPISPFIHELDINLYR